jgi:fluoride exporter
VGVLGGFTTFSAFSLETALMMEKRLYLSAGLYAAASVVLSVGALFAGLMAARRLFA